MDRRRLLKLIAIGGGLLGERLLIHPGIATERLDARSFYAAGVRFHKISRELRSGDFLSVSMESFEGRTCYGILTADGEKIGYLPRTLLPYLDNRRVVECRVLSVNRDTVPWKRYRIMIVTKAGA